jgi:hypothetical protein
LCIDGTCESAPTCTTDDDCSVGRCVQGKCSALTDEGGVSRKYRKNWFGLHIAQDVAFVGGKDVCTQANQADNYYACYYAGSSTAPYMNEPYPGVNVNTGLVAATTRVLLSLDRVITPNITLGGRIGFAFGGGPPNGRLVTYQSGTTTVSTVTDEGTKFFPVHIEARVAYWFGSRVFERKLRPYVHAGGGMAEFDAKVKIPVRDCGPPELSSTAACAAGAAVVNSGTLTQADLDAWKKFGFEFITVGGGVVYNIQDNYGVQANFNLIYTLPSSGVVLQPSIGVVAGY